MDLDDGLINNMWFFLLQLSVTIGIMLAYLFGMFLPWRVLAVAGKITEPSEQDVKLKITQLSL